MLVARCVAYLSSKAEENPKQHGVSCLCGATEASPTTDLRAGRTLADSILGRRLRLTLDRGGLPPTGRRRSIAQRSPRNLVRSVDPIVAQELFDSGEILPSDHDAGRVPFGPEAGVVDKRPISKVSDSLRLLWNMA